MSFWFEQYKSTMYRSNAIGVVGSLMLVSCILREISKFYSALSTNETISFSAIENDLILIGSSIVIGIVALWRIVILVWSRSHSYAWQILSWWLLALGLSAYIYLASPNYHSQVCDEGGVCFGIYEIRDYTNFVAIGGSLFLSLSFVRFIITAGYAYSRNRLK